MKKSILTKSQKRRITKTFIIDGIEIDKTVTIRYDDECGNGHNSFSITNRNGCDHDNIRNDFPELEYLIKWHLCSSDGPMHYVANTVYHAQDTDCDGLKKGEYSAFKKIVVAKITKDKKPVSIYKTDAMYANKQKNPNLIKCNGKEELKLNEFILNLDVDFDIIEEPCEYSKSKGKKSDLQAARSCAIWPEATLEQLQDKKLLADRLPGLLKRFKKDVESIGFTY